MTRPQQTDWELIAFLLVLVTLAAIVAVSQCSKVTAALKGDTACLKFCDSLDASGCTMSPMVPEQSIWSADGAERYEWLCSAEFEDSDELLAICRESACVGLVLPPAGDGPWRWESLP